jgi:hypothetical protein
MSTIIGGDKICLANFVSTATTALSVKIETEILSHIPHFAFPDT